MAACECPASVEECGGEGDWVRTFEDSGDGHRDAGAVGEVWSDVVFADLSDVFAGGEGAGVLEKERV